MHSMQGSGDSGTPERMSRPQFTSELPAERSRPDAGLR